MLISTFIILLGYFVAYSVLLWYVTCTTHKKVPAILSVIYFFLCMIPAANYFICGIYVLVLKEEFHNEIKLKNNWFNRTFLAYNAE